MKRMLAMSFGAPDGGAGVDEGGGRREGHAGQTLAEGLLLRQTSWTKYVCSARGDLMAARNVPSAPGRLRSRGRRSMGESGFSTVRSGVALGRRLCEPNSRDRGSARRLRDSAWLQGAHGLGPDHVIQFLAGEGDVVGGHRRGPWEKP